MKNRQLSLIFFLIAQLYIYVLLICFNSFINVKVLSYTSIVLCFIIGIFMFCKTKDYYIMILSLFFTLIGDTFFIFFKNLSVIGLICLNITQILYFLRIYLDSEYKKANVLIRLISIPISIIIVFITLKNETDILAILWIMFSVNLFINILFTIKEIGINNFFPIGLLLMFIYGIAMMFIYLPNYLTTNVRFIDILIQLPFDIKWVFYLPSQVVLTCSIFTVNRKCFSKIKIDSK